MKKNIGGTPPRVPKLNFPVDDDGMTVLLRDMVMYSSGAVAGTSSIRFRCCYY